MCSLQVSVFAAADTVVVVAADAAAVVVAAAVDDDTGDGHWHLQWPEEWSRHPPG